MRESAYNRVALDHTLLLSSLAQWGDDLGAINAMKKRFEVAFYLLSVAIGELQQGVESIRHRDGFVQAELLERWQVSLVTGRCRANWGR